MLIFSVISGAFVNSEKYIQALQEESEKNLVIIDAGHGGEDPGAVGCDGVYEKDLNLQIAISNYAKLCSFAAQKLTLAHCTTLRLCDMEIYAFYPLQFYWQSHRIKYHDVLWLNCYL